MDQPSLYDDDIVTWAEQQAAALRALGERADLSNAIDWENVAEEIESVGRSQIRAVESLLAQTLAHCLKRLSAPDVPSAVHWRQEIVTFQIAARGRYERAMRQRIDMDRVWSTAIEQATSALAIYGDTILPHLPTRCPLTPDELLSSAFDIDVTFRQIALSTTRRPADHS